MNFIDTFTNIIVTIITLMFVLAIFYIKQMHKNKDTTEKPINDVEKNE